MLYAMSFIYWCGGCVLIYGQFSTRPLNAFLSSTDQALDHRVLPFKLPPLTRMMLADVDAGSDTPSLIGKVLKWRKAESAQGK